MAQARGLFYQGLPPSPLRIGAHVTTKKKKKRWMTCKTPSACSAVSISNMDLPRHECFQHADNGHLARSFLPGMEMRHLVADREGVELLYKPHMDFLWGSLIGKAPGLKNLPFDLTLRHRESSKGQQGAMVQNWLLSSNRLRRIRLTYFDAGSAGQAFNSLLYPDYRFDFPLLGIDLISFGKKNVLYVIDFQPLSQDPDYLHKYTAGLAPICNSVRKICSRMSTRIYNENEYFSKQLIFFRSNKGAVDPALQVPNGPLYRVYMAYVESYLNWLHALEPQEDPRFKAYVKSRQAGYDAYSSERDPAIKVFSTYFGEKWSVPFAEQFLFPLAKVV